MKKKLLTVVGLVLCAVLLVVGSIFGTFAYLTSTPDPVTNTFTVGKVEITLDEAKVTEYGVEVANADRVKENAYKLIPGHKYIKDPTIHVAADSEDCWVFVKIDNGLGADATLNIDSTKWEQIGTTNVYYYNTIAKAGENCVAFDKFTVSDNANVSTYKDAKIVVTAYAIQADGFATAEAAWAVAPTTWTNP